MREKEEREERREKERKKEKRKKKEGKEKEKSEKRKGKKKVKVNRQRVVSAVGGQQREQGKNLVQGKVRLKGALCDTRVRVCATQGLGSVRHKG